MVRTILFDLYLWFTDDYSRIPFHPCRETFPILLLILYLILGATYVRVDLKIIRDHRVGISIVRGGKSIRIFADGQP
jgi:hypothetical protein